MGERRLSLRQHITSSLSVLLSNQATGIDGLSATVMYLSTITPHPLRQSPMHTQHTGYFFTWRSLGHHGSTMGPGHTTRRWISSAPLNYLLLSLHQLSNSKTWYDPPTVPRSDNRLAYIQHSVFGQVMHRDIGLHISREITSGLHRPAPSVLFRHNPRDDHVTTRLDLAVCWGGAAIQW